MVILPVCWLGLQKLFHVPAKAIRESGRAEEVIFCRDNKARMRWRRKLVRAKNMPIEFDREPAAPLG
jgi:hypothetical protein